MFSKNSFFTRFQIDAHKYPKIGEIPKWQFTTINEGDCLYLPSQMWHQVKSYGASNQAVAFLFSQFIDNNPNVSACSEKNQEPVFLSKVDVDLQYPGTGVMGMGYSQLHTLMDRFKKYIVDKKTGYITKKGTYKFVKYHHGDDVSNNTLLFAKKAKALYYYFLEIADGVEQNMNQSFVESLTRDQVRKTYHWVFRIEPSNSYEHEYSYFTPEELSDLVDTLFQNNGDTIQKQVFLDEYYKAGGTEKVALEFWHNLAGDADEVTDASKNMEKALKKYEYYRRENADTDDEGEDSVNITPQGHQTRPKHERGGYSEYKEEEKEIEAVGKKEREEL